MSEQESRTSKKHLSAEELLRNRGICKRALNKWEESSRALPKTGAKLFEPNGSWLQNKQIEKGLESRKFLLGIERVERASQLASAEWLPEQKKARVTKKTGQEWMNYGFEVNANLYLIPEEALVLLETECLELTWDGVPLSIQQAYEVLIDSEGSDCTLDEYRVYSQLTRLGYRLQRFCYEKSQLERSTRLEEIPQRKKVIINPENGLWMTGNNVESAQTSTTTNHETDIDNEIREIVENIVTTVNDNNSDSRKSDNERSEEITKSKDAIVDEKLSERRLKNSKVEIVSEQTIFAPIKIIKDGTTAEQLVSKWPGSRIQRNVKLLPKRNDIAVVNAETLTPCKRRCSSPIGESSNGKKSKHEVIDLSDDEIEEIPRPMSRMEMLNRLPNIANDTFIMENISPRYLPPGVQPQRSCRYDTRKLKTTQDTPTRSTNNSQSFTNNNRSDGSRTINENPQNNSRNSSMKYPRNSTSTGIHSNNRYNGNENNRQSYYPHVNNEYSSSSVVMTAPGTLCMQRMTVGPGGWQKSQTVIAGNRWASFQMNMHRNFGILGYAVRNTFFQNVIPHNGHSLMGFGAWSTMQQQQQQQHYQQHQHYQMQRQNNYPRQLIPSPGQFSRPSCAPRFSTSTPSRSFENSRENFRSNRDNRGNNWTDEIYQSAFVKLPGANTWPELKQKWRDAKTITIDDDETSKTDGSDDCSDVQIVDQTIKPLVNCKNSRNISEIFERLRIIKSAPDRTFRRKKRDLKISYNVYSGGQHFRKTNPGMPMFHLVITTEKHSDVLQPVQLNRLHQDGKGASLMFARVSNSSITYLQPGIVCLPNLI